MSAAIVTFGDQIDERAYAQLERCASGEAVSAVLCADHHVGYSMPIGGVVAYREHVSPSGVGYDIACGNKAVLTDALVSDIDVAAVMDEIVRRISFGIGRDNNERVEHPVIERIKTADYPWQRNLVKHAEAQLGTVGGGNHYVDLFADEDQRVWIGAHFGSRGFGHKTATHFLEQARAKDGIDAPPCLLNVDTALGQSYIAAMRLAGEYAYAGRDIVCATVLEILGARSLDEVHNHHNFAWLEEHGGESVWVIRKGATPAFPGQRGFVGGSMGEMSVILEGLDAELSGRALYSTVHGAGRQMSRSEAAGRVRRGRVLKPGRIDWDETRRELGDLGIELRGGAADEAPPAYKRLHEVLAAHEGTIAVRHVLTPIGVAMAGPDTVRPVQGLRLDARVRP